jgi:KUP system potassium uptake protein
MAKGVPLALSHNVHVLHERVLLVAANMTEAPRAPEHDRFVVAPIAEGITRLELRFGFMEEPNIPERLVEATASGRIEPFDLGRAYYTDTRRSFRPGGARDCPDGGGVVRLPAPQRPAPGAFFKIPGSQIMEIGVEFEV